MESKENTLKSSFVSGDILLFKEIITKETCEKIIDSYSKKLFEMDMSNNEYFKNNEYRPEISFLEMRSEISNILHGKCKAILNEMASLYGNVGIIGNSPFRYNEYKEGRGYRKHIDRSNKAAHLKDREISVIFGLNDDYEGGHLLFHRQEVKITLGHGDVIVFPSGYTHPHEVTPVTKGTRKTIVTWLS